VVTQQEYLELMAEKPSLWIPNEVMIRAKSRKIIPFQPNVPQQRLGMVWDDLIARHLPVRIVVLKGRQEGISTYVQARILHQLIHEPNTGAATVCHDQASTIKMRDRIMGTMIRMLNPPYNVQKKRKPGEFINESFIDTLTAGSRKAGRSQTINLAHLSEVAFWHRGDMGDAQADEVLGGFLQSVPDLPGTVVIMESTADGARGAFHDYCTNTPEGWRFVFLPYYELLEYRIPLTEDEKRVNDKLQVAWKTGNILVVNECCKALGLTPDERTYRLGGGHEGAAVPLAALKWRRRYGLAKCKNDPVRFAQEYPANIQEAFIASGQPAFAPGVIAKWEVEGYRDIQEIPDTHGYGVCTAFPVSGRRYLIGVDVAEGCEVPNDDNDYTVCVIHDPVERRPVAIYRSQETPRVAAHAIACLSRMYRPADSGVVVERNGPGLALLDRLVDYGVPLWGGKPKSIGFKTTKDTRPMMLGYLQDVVREQLVANPGIPILMKELKDMQQTRGRVDHASGHHDDCVVAWALALAPQAMASEQLREVQEEPLPPNHPGAKLALNIDFEMAELRRREAEYDAERD